MTGIFKHIHLHPLQHILKTMIIDLTTNVSINNPIFDWVRSQNNIPLAMGHIGTHLDTYEKTNIPLEYFKSRGVVFHVVGIVEVCTSHIAVENIKEGDFVLFRTGQLEKYGYGKEEYFQNHPQLSNELIQELIVRKVRFIGIDAPGIRQHAEHRNADCLCERAGVYVIENLCNLDKLSNNSSMTIYAMWLDDSEVTGLRCRVLAELDEK